ncbi:MAG: hypothetical protein HQK60_01895 [Deltaproteobacteria bacterium]|nr:hypothetical protein [Deltaproteobacteria bacterium]
MQYDVSTKILIAKCGREIIHRLIGIRLTDDDVLEELPQETVSLKRADAVIMVTDKTGNRRIVLIEIQTAWDRDVPLRLLDYRTRYRLKYGLEAISSVLLLQPSGQAVAQYEDNEVSFRFRLIRVYDLDAQDIVQEGLICLMPFVPLMRHGKDLVGQADDLIYESSLPRKDKADMLGAMAIFSSLVSRDIPRMLFSKRRDIMIDSPAYEVFKEVVYEDVWKDLTEKYQLEGLTEDEKKIRLAMLLLQSRNDVIKILKFRFETLPPAIVQAINELWHPDILDKLLISAVTAPSLEQFTHEMDEELARRAQLK